MNRFENDSRQYSALKKAGKHLGEVTLAATILSGAATAINATETNKVDGATVRTYNCSSTIDQWKPINANEITVIKASAAVLTFDGSVNGVTQNDNLSETATVVGLKTKNNTDKNWIAGTQYGGSVFILKCKSTFSRFYSAFGSIITSGDIKLGLNNPKKSIQAQVVEQ